MLNIKKAIDSLARLIGLFAVGVIVGAVILLTTGCHAVSGLGRDLTETSDMLYGGIQAYYSGPLSDHDREMAEEKDRRRRIVKNR